MSDIVRVEIDGPVCVISLNQPAIRNAISDLPMVDAIVGALGRLAADPAIRVAVLTGVGAVFSAGGNLKTLGAPGELGGGAPVDTRTGYQLGIQRIPLAFRSVEVPMIAAVNGPAIGAGCDLACMCDIRIAGESASFAESFVRLGLIPGDGGAWFLQRVIGYARAAELSFTGETVDSSRALELGLVSKVVPDGELMAAALDLARRIAANPPHAVRMTKRLLQQARDGRLEDTLSLSAAMQSLAHTTSDHQEAVQAFKGKRPPVFTGS